MASTSTQSVINPIQLSTTPESSINTPTTPLINKGKARQLDSDKDDEKLSVGKPNGRIAPPKGWLHFVAGG